MLTIQSLVAISLRKRVLCRLTMQKRSKWMLLLGMSSSKISLPSATPLVTYLVLLCVQSKVLLRCGLSPSKCQFWLRSLSVKVHPYAKIACSVLFFIPKVGCLWLSYVQVLTRWCTENLRADPARSGRLQLAERNRAFTWFSPRRRYIKITLPKVRSPWEDFDSSTGANYWMRAFHPVVCGGCQLRYVPVSLRTYKGPYWLIF